MFRRVVQAAGGDPGPFQVEEDLAVFGGVRWSNGNVLDYCRLVAVKTEGCDIPYYFKMGNRQHEVRYFRFELDEAIGDFFTHPHPHVHSQPHGGPRYALNGWPAANAIVDFLEHVYLTHFHDQWRQWARRLWLSNWQTTEQTVAGERFDRAMQAAHESKYGVLLQLAPDVEQLKGLLRVKKDELFPLRLAMDRRGLLAYPV